MLFAFPRPAQEPKPASLHCHITYSTAVAAVMEDHNFDSVADKTLNHIAHRLKHIFSQVSHCVPHFAFGFRSGLSSFPTHGHFDDRGESLGSPRYPFAEPWILHQP